jgi:LAO/AO transport system kinase
MLARSISMIENRVEGTLSAMASLDPKRKKVAGSPRVVGITGPPGAGKSTFVNLLITEARGRGERVVVLAVDPSSPFTGGAILADRIRMEEHVLDEGVFIRSLSSRGHLGGLSRAVGQVVDLIDAAGWDLVIVETVGVGQSELAVCEIADTAVVILTPESGDAVQAMKAGLLEIADLFVINKSDRPGADVLVRELELAVELDEAARWKAPVVKASAITGDGVGDVVRQIILHGDWCEGEGASEWSYRQGRGRVRTFLDLVGEDARFAAFQALHGERSALRESLENGESNPYRVAEEYEA